MKKGDIALAAAVLLLAASAAIWYWRPKAQGEGIAVVTADGAVLFSMPLSVDAEREAITEYGSNIITVRDGAVSVTDADCPDKLCVRQGKISRDGESIVCLPHRLVVSVEHASDGGDGADVIAR